MIDVLPSGYQDPGFERLGDLLPEPAPGPGPSKRTVEALITEDFRSNAVETILPARPIDLAPRPQVTAARRAPRESARAETLADCTLR